MKANALAEETLKSLERYASEVASRGYHAACVQVSPAQLLSLLAEVRQARKVTAAVRDFRSALISQRMDGPQILPEWEALVAALP